MSQENRGFTARVIREIESRSVEELYVWVITEYLMRKGRILWDDNRALFWVNCPEREWMVAVWMMPIALRFEPIGRGR